MVQPSILKSHKHLQMVKTHFHNGLLQNHCLLSAKGMKSNFVVVVSDLPPIYCHIGWGMPSMCIFMKKLSRYTLQLLINECEHLSVVRIRT